MSIYKVIMHRYLINLIVFLLPVYSLAGNITGQVKTQEGKAIAGVIITLTSTDGLYTDTVYSNDEGEYVLPTERVGTVSIRARKAYYHDVTQNTQLQKDSTASINFSLSLMTDPEEISNSLPASAHFAKIKFDDPKDKEWFQVDCVTCHQLGNAHTRSKKSVEEWSAIITRMKTYMRVENSRWAEHYAEILAKSFDGSLSDTRQEHKVDPMIYSARIRQWKLPTGLIAHDVEYNHHDGHFYTVDQGSDKIYITNPETTLTETYVIPDGGIPIGGKFMRLFGIPNPYSLAVRRGPHSLQQGPNGHFYTADTISGQIGEFDPQTRSYIGHEIGGDLLYPHTLRFDKKDRLWFTGGGSTHVGYYDTVNDRMNVIKVPADTDREEVPLILPYGMDIHPIDDSAWFTYLFGNRIGRVEPETMEVKLYTLPLTGPRRMRFSADGTLWIPGFGSGNLVKLDTKTMKHTSYKIPVLSEGENEAPYAVGIHPDTQEVWITTNMSDRMFRFLPEEERFVAYPLPLRGIYTRDVIFTPHGWVCGASSPVPAPLTVEGGVQEIVCLDPNGNNNAISKVSIN